MREGQAVYSITGQSLITPAGEEPFGGEREDSASLKNAPQVLREHMDAVWQQVYKRPWSKPARHRTTTLTAKTSNSTRASVVMRAHLPTGVQGGVAPADTVATGEHSMLPPIIPLSAAPVTSQQDRSSRHRPSAGGADTTGCRRRGHRPQAPS
jgi:hypothetical protein